MTPPRACSGDRYCAVPMIEPASVIWLAPARAMPKSVTFTRPSASHMTLCGLMSRWTMPFRCATFSAPRMSRVNPIASPTASGPRAQGCP